MEHLQEWLILWAALCVSIGLLIYCLRKKPIMEWLLVFFMKAFIATPFDNYLVKTGHFTYPTRFLPHQFDTSLIFDYLAFPVLCILFNQTSYKSSPAAIFMQAVLYSSGLALVEYYLEKQTLVIHYLNWNWICSFVLFIFTFLLVRSAMGLVRKIDRKMKGYITEGQ